MLTTAAKIRGIEGASECQDISNDNSQAPELSLSSVMDMCGPGSAFGNLENNLQ